MLVSIQHHRAEDMRLESRDRSLACAEWSVEQLGESRGLQWLGAVRFRVTHGETSRAGGLEPEKIVLNLTKVTSKNFASLVGIAVTQRFDNGAVLQFVFFPALRRQRVAFEPPPFTLLTNAVGQFEYFKEKGVVRCQRKRPV